MAKFTISASTKRMLTRQVAQQIGEQWYDNIKDEISSVKWEYPGETKRKSGEIAGSPRNIVDTGQLLNSAEFEMINDNTARVTLAGHGLYVHEGYRTKNSFVPPRPFTLTAAQNLNLDNVELNK